MEVKAWSYKQDSLAADLAFLMRSRAPNDCSSTRCARSSDGFSGAPMVRRLVRGDTKCECGGSIRPLPIEIVDRKPGFRRLLARVFYQRRPAKRPAKLPILLFIKLEKLPAVTVDDAA